jgi:cell division septal protein FtsQ
MVYLVWQAGKLALDRLVFHNPAFEIQSLEIDTSGILPPELIRAWSGIERGQNLINLDLDRVKRDLELVPVIASVSIQRLPPDTLRIRVVPRVPVGEVQVPVLRHEGGLRLATYYLDRNGVVLQFPEAEDALLKMCLVKGPLPQIIGLPVNRMTVGRQLRHENLRPALDLIEQFRTSRLVASTGLAVIDTSRADVLEVSTTHGSHITLGLAGLPQQLARWSRVNHYAAQRGLVIAEMDLSVKNNVPVVFAEGPAVNSRPASASTRTPRNTNCCSTAARSSGGLCQESVCALLCRRASDHSTSTLLPRHA